MATVFNGKQLDQECSYDEAYHWKKRPNTQSGRLYFGYLHAAADCISDFPKNASILDAGCGDARLLGVLRDRGYTALSGVDYSERAIMFARTMVPESVFAVADLTSLPFPDGSFDAIFCIETLEHIIPSDIPSVLEEFRRVLSPQGVLIVTVPSLLQGVPPSEHKHYQHFTPESLRAYLEPYFVVERLFGQDRVGFHPLKVVYKLIDNNHWSLPALRDWYNLRLWPNLFNTCDAHRGRRLIAFARNNHA